MALLLLQEVEGCAVLAEAGLDARLLILAEGAADLEAAVGVAGVGGEGLAVERGDDERVASLGVEQVVLEAVVQVGAETREEGRVMREAVTRGGEVVQVVQGAEGARGT